MGGYTFRFYGRIPDYFDEEHTVSTVVSVVLARTPDADELRELGKGWERCARRVLDLAFSSVTWSGPLALITAHGRWWGAERAVLRAVTDMLFRWHRTCQIVDVVNHGTRAEGRWDRWSLGEGSPRPGPAALPTVLHPPYARPTDESLPPLAPSTAFAEGCDLERVRSEREQLLASAKSPAARKLGLAPTEAAPMEPRFAPEVWTADVQAALGPTHRRVPGTAIPVVWDGDSFAVYAEGGWQIVPIDLGYRKLTGRAVASPDGRFLQVTGVYSVHEIDLEARTASCWYATPDTNVRVGGVGYLPDDRRVVCISGQLLVFDVDETRDEDGGTDVRLTLATSTKVAESSSLAFRTALGGSVLVPSGGRKSYVFFGYLDGEIKRYGAIGGSATFAGETPEGDVLLADAAGTLHRVTGLAESRADLEAKVQKARRVKAAKGGRGKPQEGSRPKVSLEALDWRPPRAWEAEREIPESVRAHFPEGAILEAQAAGIVTGYWRHGAGFALWRPSTAEYLDLTPKLEAARPRLHIRGGHVSPAGDAITFADNQAVHVVDLRALRLTTIAEKSALPIDKLGVLESLCLLGPDDVALRFERGVGWLHRDGDAFCQLPARKVPKTVRVLPAGPGPDACVVLTGAKHRVYVLAPDIGKGRLTELAKFEEYVDGAVYAAEGFAVVYNFRLEQAWRVLLTSS